MLEVARQSCLDDFELEDLSIATVAPPPCPPPRPLPMLRRCASRIRTSIKILMAGDWCTGSPHCLRNYAGIDVNLWFVPAQGLTNPVMSRSYYAGATGALIVFDFSKPESLVRARQWKEDIDARIFTRDGGGIPCILLGNKVHLCKDQEWQITAEEMDLFVIGNRFINFLRIHELTVENVNRAVEELIGYIRLRAIGPYEEDQVSVISQGREVRGVRSSCF